MNCHRAEVCVGKEAVTEAGTRPPCPTEQKEFPREGGKGLLLEQRAGLVQTCSVGLVPHLLRSWHDWIPQPTTLHSSQGRRATDQGTQHGSTALCGYRVSHRTAAGTAYPYFSLCPRHACRDFESLINMVADICRLPISLSFFEI